ncbi:MAG TPA: ABC transporter permease [Candidatus Sulfotelmatobacter sp.]|nr:ABC transporter permease [Candidatus Sulfotelmatobacter sp.]
MTRIRALFRRKAAERELDAELRFHLDQQVRKFVESGMPLAEAQRRARMSMGGEEQIKEECRDARGVRFVESLAQDVRYGLRSLGKSPGFTAVAILTLMLGIGVNTALFTIVHGVLLNPLPFPRPDRLVSLWEENVIDSYATNVVSGGVFADWQKEAKSFEQMALVGEDTANLSGDGGALPESIGIRQCSFQLFSLLEVPPALGRFFTEQDDQPGATPTAVLTNGLWKRRYGSDPSIGKHLTIDWVRKPRFEIVGVVGDVLSNLDTPAEATMYLPLNSGRFDYGSLVAMTDGGHDVSALALPLEKQIAAVDPDLGVSDVLTMDEWIGKSTASAMFDALLVLSFAVLGLVLAAVGLYGLLSYLVTERTHEIGIRMALGAQRLEVMRIMFLDGLGPTVVGLVVGLVGGGICAQLIRSGLFGVEPLDWKVFGAVAMVVLAIAGAACTYPAWRGARVDPMTALRCE